MLKHFLCADFRITGKMSNTLWMKKHQTNMKFWNWGPIIVLYIVLYNMTCVQFFSLKNHSTLLHSNSYGRCLIKSIFTAWNTLSHYASHRKPSIKGGSNYAHVMNKSVFKEYITFSNRSAFSGMKIQKKLKNNPITALIWMNMDMHYAALLQ